MSQPKSEAILSHAPVRIFAVIILYKITAAESPTYRTLLQSCADLAPGAVDLKILLYDNSPGAHPQPDLPGNVQYLAASANKGLADAYNAATELAGAEGFTWLLTLDQDTELPQTFLSDLAVVAVSQQDHADVAAIVPHISAGSRSVSPNWFAGGCLPRWFPQDFHGIPKTTVYAFNSGSTLRVDALRRIGGYSALFWLDYCDAYIYRSLARAGYRVFVAARIHLQHDFSLLDVKNKMSLQRYANSLEAGSAFYDSEMSTLAGLEHTLRLTVRFLKQIYKKTGSDFSSATFSTLRRRLLLSRKTRLQEWTRLQEARIAAYPTETTRASS